MNEQRKDIFGNPYTLKNSVNKPVSFEQKLREAKAKQRYKKFQAEQRSQQLQKFKQTAGRSRQGLKKVGGLLKKGYGRVTDKRLTSFREKVRGSIYKKE